MSLGTNYKRNADRGEAAIADRLEKAKAIARELNGNLDLAAAVVLGRKTMEQAIAESVSLTRQR